MISDEKMIESLARLIEIPSVTRKNATKESPFGKETEKALDAALDICRELGFRTKNCNYKTGWAEIGQGDEIVGILCHLDVVPEGDGWTKPPFKLTREDGFLYGRGTADDKGPAISAIYAMKDVLDENIALKRRVRIIFGLSEEGGSWDDMEYYKANEELPAFGFTPDGDYPVLYAEKGILNLKLKMPLSESGIVSADAGTAPNVVPHKCEITVTGSEENAVTVYGEGRAAHGSMPEKGINAISDCVRKILENGYKCRFAEMFSELIGRETDGESLGIKFEDDKSGKLTLNAGMLKSDENELTLTLDIRGPVDISNTEVVDIVRKKCEPYGVTVVQSMWSKPLYIDKNDPMIQVLLGTYREMTGDTMVEPKAIGGGTYAKAMDRIVAFGAAFPDKENSEHMADEHVCEDDFLLNRKIYKKAIIRLANIEF